MGFIAKCLSSEWVPPSLTSFSLFVQQPYFFPLFFLVPLHNILIIPVTVLVLWTSFTSPMLVKRTRPVRQWKSGSLLDAYGINRIGIGFSLLQFYLWTPTRQPARNHFPYDGGNLVSSSWSSVFLSYKSTTPALTGLSIADVASVFNDAQLNDVNTLSICSIHHARSLPSTTISASFSRRAGE